MDSLSRTSTGESSLDQQPFNKNRSEIERSHDLALVAYEEAKNGDFVTAAKLFSKAIELNQGDARLYVNRSYCYDQLTFYQLALDDAEKAIKLNNGSLQAYYRKGRALLGLEKPEEAEFCFNNVLASDPKHQDAKAQLLACRILALKKLGCGENLAVFYSKQYNSVREACSAAIDKLLFQGFQEFQVLDDYTHPSPSPDAHNGISSSSSGDSSDGSFSGSFPATSFPLSSASPPMLTTTTNGLFSLSPSLFPPFSQPFGTSTSGGHGSGDIGRLNGLMRTNNQWSFGGTITNDLRCDEKDEQLNLTDPNEALKNSTALKSIGSEVREKKLDVKANTFGDVTGFLQEENSSRSNSLLEMGLSNILNQNEGMSRTTTTDLNQSQDSSFVPQAPVQAPQQQNQYQPQQQQQQSSVWPQSRNYASVLKTGPSTNVQTRPSQKPVPFSAVAKVVDQRGQGTGKVSTLEDFSRNIGKENTVDERKPTNIMGYKGLWVCNVNPDLKYQALQKIFSKYGIIRKIQIFEKAATNGSNIVFVHYDNAESPRDAIADLTHKPKAELACMDATPLKMRFVPNRDQNESFDLTKSQAQKLVEKTSECFYWRLSEGCHSGSACPFKHIPINQGIDSQPWVKMAKRKN